MLVMKRLCLLFAALLLAAGGIGAGAAGPAEAKTKDGKYLIYLSLSYSGNAWQSEAANIVKALAKTPPFDQTVAPSIQMLDTE